MVKKQQMQSAKQSAKQSVFTTMDEETNRRVYKAWDELALMAPKLAKYIGKMHWWADNDGNIVTTASTNGRNLIVFPKWWARLTHKERVFILAHEGVHVAQRAFADNSWMTAEQRTQHNRMNIALDLAANNILQSDRHIGKYLSTRLIEEGEFIQNRNLPHGMSCNYYFDVIGQQQEDNEEGGGKSIDEMIAEELDKTRRDNNESNTDENADENADENTDGNTNGNTDVEGKSKSVDDRRMEDSDFTSGIRCDDETDPLVERVRMSVIPSEDQNAIHNWRNILREMLWKRTFASRNTKRPSRRWDGKGVMIPGRSSRDFPKTALILDYSSSMSGYLRVCASTIAALVAEVSTGEVMIYGCTHYVTFRRRILRNESAPTTDELLAHYVGGCTDMMPAIKEARKWGARLILCVSDMETPLSNLMCPDVVWITSVWATGATDTNADNTAKVRGIVPAGKVFRVLRVRGDTYCY